MIKYDASVLISLARVMLFRVLDYAEAKPDRIYYVLISLARVMLFRGNTL